MARGRDRGLRRCQERVGASAPPIHRASQSSATAVMGRLPLPLLLLLRLLVEWRGAAAEQGMARSSRSREARGRAGHGTKAKAMPVLTAAPPLHHPPQIHPPGPPPIPPPPPPPWTLHRGVLAHFPPHTGVQARGQGQVQAQHQRGQQGGRREQQNQVQQQAQRGGQRQRQHGRQRGRQGRPPRRRLNRHGRTGGRRGWWTASLVLPARFRSSWTGRFRSCCPFETRKASGRGPLPAPPRGKRRRRQRGRRRRRQGRENHLGRLGRQRRWTAGFRRVGWVRVGCRHRPHLPPSPRQPGTSRCPHTSPHTCFHTWRPVPWAFTPRVHTRRCGEGRVAFWAHTCPPWSMALPCCPPVPCLCPGSDLQGGWHLPQMRAWGQA